MTLDRRRDRAVIEQGLVRWLGERRAGRGTATVAARHASAGLSNETLIVDASYADGSAERLVVRLPPLVASFPRYDLVGEATVMAVAHEAGIPVPAPVEVEEDPSFLGTTFLAMPFVEGHVPAQAPAFDPWIIGAPHEAQAAVHHAFIETLAAIHEIGPERASLGGPPADPQGALDAEVARWGEYLAWAFEGAPPEALAEAFAWCAAQRPADDGPAVLCWGDARLGNVIFDDDRRIVAVLDWEMAVAGPPGLDLGWYLAQLRAMDEILGRRVPGFPDHAGVVRAYEAAAGRALGAVAWFEIFGLFRQLAVFERQAVLAVRAGLDPPVPLGVANPLVTLLGRLIAAA